MQRAEAIQPGGTWRADSGVFLERQAARLQAEGESLAARVAALADQRALTEDAVAATLERLAQLRPAHATRLRDLAEHARESARTEREHAARWAKYARTRAATLTHVRWDR